MDVSGEPIEGGDQQRTTMTPTMFDRGSQLGTILMPLAAFNFGELGDPTPSVPRTTSRPTLVTTVTGDSTLTVTNTFDQTATATAFDNAFAERPVGPSEYLSNTGPKSYVPKV
jgi:hypothetical protein